MEEIIEISIDVDPYCSMNERYYFIKFTYFILQTFKLCKIKISKSYVREDLKGVSNTSQAHKINKQ